MSRTREDAAAGFATPSSGKAASEFRAGAYVRLSYDPDGTSDAVARQEEDVKEFLRARGWRHTTTYHDNDRSAWQPRVCRPEFERMLQDIAAGSLDVVVVWKTDRLARRAWDLERFLRVTEDAGVEVVSVTEPLAEERGMTRFVLRQLVAFANYESEVKSQRVKRKMLENARQGKPGGGCRPFGYDEDRVSLHEAEAELIRQATGRLLKGEVPERLAEEWNENGIRGAGGSPWDADRLLTLLTSARVIGLREHLGQRYDAVWPAIISSTDQATISRLVEAREFGWNKRNPGRPPSHLLTGFLRCGKCGLGMYGCGGREELSIPSSNKLSRYICQKRRGAGNCGSTAVRSRDVDPAVANAFFIYLSNEKAQQCRNKVRQEAEHYGLLRLLGHYCESSLRQKDLAAAYALGDISEAIWKTRRSKVTESLKITERRLHALTDVDGFRERRRIQDTWDEVDCRQRRRWLESCLDRVLLSQTGRGIRFSPDRIEYVWKY